MPVEGEEGVERDEAYLERAIENMSQNIETLRVLRPQKFSNRKRVTYV